MSTQSSSRHTTAAPHPAIAPSTLENFSSPTGLSIRVHCPTCRAHMWLSTCIRFPFSLFPTSASKFSSDRLRPSRLARRRRAPKKSSIPCGVPPESCLRFGSRLCCWSGRVWASEKFRSDGFRLGNGSWVAACTDLVLGIASWGKIGIVKWLWFDSVRHCESLGRV